MGAVGRTVVFTPAARTAAGIELAGVWWGVEAVVAAGATGRVAWFGRATGRA